MLYVGFHVIKHCIIYLADQFETHRFLRFVQEDAMDSPGLWEQSAKCHGEAKWCRPGTGLKCGRVLLLIHQRFIWQSDNALPSVGLESTLFTWEHTLVTFPVTSVWELTFLRNCVTRSVKLMSDCSRDARTLHSFWGFRSFITQLNYNNLLITIVQNTPNFILSSK